jgi:hypothetical protein
MNEPYIVTVSRELAALKVVNREPLRIRELETALDAECAKVDDEQLENVAQYLLRSDATLRALAATNAYEAYKAALFRADELTRYSASQRT